MTVDPFSILNRLGEMFGRHVNYEDLLAFRDGEAARIAGWRVRAHLVYCDACAETLDLIERDLQTAASIDHAIYSSDLIRVSTGLDNLRGSIRRWESQGGFSGVASELAPLVRERMLRRLTQEIGFYFGDHVAATFLANHRSGMASDRNPLVEAESVLREFLGPGAASEITQRVVRLQKSMDRYTTGALPA